MEKLFLVNIRGELFHQRAKKEVIKYLVFGPIFLLIWCSLLIISSILKDSKLLLYLSIFLSTLSFSFTVLMFCRLLNLINNTIKNVQLNYVNEQITFKTYSIFLRDEKQTTFKFKSFSLDKGEFSILLPKNVEGWHITYNGIMLSYISDFFDEELLEELKKYKKNF